MQTDSVLEQLRRTRLHFVHCFLPQHNAGLCDVKAVMNGNNAAAAAAGNNKSPDDILMNVPLVRSQVSGLVCSMLVGLSKKTFESFEFRTFK